MINDGGAERMVRNRKTEWWQVLAIVIMFIFIAVVMLFFYFVINGEQMVDALNKATVGEAYDILTDIKSEYTDLAVTSYQKNDDSVDIEFKYYETILDKDINFWEYSYKVKTAFENYLEKHPEDFINKGLKVTLRFPNVLYTNVSKENEFEYSASFDNVSYRYSDKSVSEFVENIAFIGSVLTLTLEADEAALELSGLKLDTLLELDGLKALYIEKNNLTATEKDELLKKAEEKGIKISIEAGE